MHTPSLIKRIPLLRNIIGAVVGAVLAMGLYGAYGIGSRTLASVFPPAPIVDTHREDAARTEKLLKVAAHAKAIAESRDKKEAMQVH